MKDFWENFKPAWFKWLVVGILGGSVLWWAFGCTTDARATTIDRFAIENVGDSVRVGVGYHSDPTADSARVRLVMGLERDSAMVAVGSGIEFFMFEAPAEGVTVTFVGTITSWKGTAAPISVSKNQQWTSPVNPQIPPTIDSITVEIVEQALLQATAVQDIAISAWNGSCEAEWASLGEYQWANVIRAKGTPPAWCHEYLVSDTMSSYTAKSNWLQVKMWQEENQA